MTSSSETGFPASSKPESSATTKESQVVLAAMLISSIDSSSNSAFGLLAMKMSSITSAYNSGLSTEGISISSMDSSSKAVHRLILLRFLLFL